MSKIDLRPTKRYRPAWLEWIDHRSGLITLMEDELGYYSTPKNFNWGYFFGSLAGITLVVMILTGIFLAMHYIPHPDHAFASVEHIMRDVNYGAIMRYVHMNGASVFFIVVYLHIFKAMYYGSYKKPRELLWIMGVIIFLVMMGTAFFGYVLPWGQMSFYGAQVITSFFDAIPLVGGTVKTWLVGGPAVDAPTLNRFFVLHYLLPFIIVALVLVHLVALHRFGSNNPTGVEVKTAKDVVTFHPYYTIKDAYGLCLLIIFWGALVFYAPNILGEPDNYIEANRLETPEHIVPEWYFLPFYAILKCIPNKLGGVLAMFGSIIIWLFIPWLDTSSVKSCRYRPIFKWCVWLLLIDMLVLGYLGAKTLEGFTMWIARLGTAYYFAHFIFVMPLLGWYERTLKLPESISSDFAKQVKG